MESDINAYAWRELTDSEYHTIFKSHMLLYKTLGVIISVISLILLFFCVVYSFGFLFNLFVAHEFGSEIISVIFNFCFVFLLGWFRRWIYVHGEKYFKSKSWLACNCIVQGVDCERTCRRGNDVSHYYIKTLMPDLGTLRIPCSDSVGCQATHGDAIVVYRESTCVDETYMNVLYQDNIF